MRKAVARRLSGTTKGAALIRHRSPAESSIVMRALGPSHLPSLRWGCSPSPVHPPFSSPRLRSAAAGFSRVYFPSFVPIEPRSQELGGLLPLTSQRSRFFCVDHTTCGRLRHRPSVGSQRCQSEALWSSITSIALHATHPPGARTAKKPRQEGPRKEDTPRPSFPCVFAGLSQGRGVSGASEARARCGQSPQDFPDHDALLFFSWPLLAWKKRGARRVGAEARSVPRYRPEPAPGVRDGRSAPTPTFTLHRIQKGR